jgi:hypothetical protein
MDLSQDRVHNGEQNETDLLFAFKGWLRSQDGQNGRLPLHAVADGSWDNEVSGKGFDFAPGSAPAATGSDGGPRGKGSIGRRLFSIIIRGFVIVLTAAVLAGATVAWQRYTEAQTKDMARAEWARAWQITARWLSSVFPAETGRRMIVAIRPQSDLAAPPVTETSSIAAAQNITVPQAASVTAPAPVAQTSDQPAAPDPIVPPAASVTAPAPAVVTAVIPPELQQTFATLRSDLADLRRMVEQIAATQEQMVQQIATVQAAELALTQKLAAPPPTTTAAVAPRNNKNRLPRAEAAVRSPSAASGTPHTGTPLPLR